MAERRQSQKGRFFLLALFVAAIHGAWWLTGEGLAPPGGLADGDSYTRLVRVERLLDTGDWFDNGLPRFNAPFGLDMHWTRPLDVLLVGLGLPLAPALGWGKALYWAGVALSPLLHVLAALVLAWAALPVLGRRAALVAGALTVAQFGVLAYAMAGRADHHMLFALVTLLALGFLIRALASGGNEGGEETGKNAFNAGLALAFGLWVGPEMLLFAGLGLAVMGLMWVWGEDEGAEGNASLALGLVVGLVIALLVERGPDGFFAVEHDRVSIVHLTPAVLMLAFWRAASAVARRGTGPAGVIPRLAPRLALGVLGAVLVIGATLALFPGALEGPMAGAPPAWFPLWALISESGSIGDVPHFLLYMGAAVFAAPWAIRRAARAWPGPDRWAWFLIAAAIVLFTVFAVFWIRWYLYACLFLSVALADLIYCADGALNNRPAGPARALVKALVIPVLAVGPLAVGAGWVYADKAAPEARINCPLGELARHLERPPWSDRPRTIVASGNFGPELLYRTRHRVVASVYHRNAEGMLAGLAILAGQDEAEILARVRRRRADLIVLCPGSVHDGYFLKTGGDSLYRRLERGDVPGWLGEVDLPAGLKGRFMMFRVLPAG